MVKLAPPTLSLEQADREFRGKYLDRSHYDLLVEEDFGFHENGEQKFIFLRSVLPPKLVNEVWQRLRQLRFRPVFRGKHPARRAALRGSRGGEMVMGWLCDLQPNGIQVRLAKPTEQYPEAYETLATLCDELSHIVEEMLPQYWRSQVDTALREPERLVGPDTLAQYVVPVSRSGKALSGESRKKAYRELWQGLKEASSSVALPIFSTLTINRSALFRSHADAKNESGLACLTAFGRFAGGDLCLPRLRVAFRLRPGDLLIADTNREQHGNIGPLAGDRISVVSYLKPVR